MIDEHGSTTSPNDTHERGASVDSERVSFAMICLRYILPALVVVAGAIVMSLGSESELEGGAGIAGAGLAIFAMNWLIRAANEGDREREREEEAREFFGIHGRWPDESPPPADRAASTPDGACATTPSRGERGASTQRRLVRPSAPRTRGARHP
jgi:hypothetical protein